MLVAHHHGFGDQSTVFQRILQRLWGDEFSAGSLDQIFLPVGDGQEALGVEVANVAGLEPPIKKAF